MSAPTVTSVTEASPAARAGLAVGDELLSLNGHEPRDVIDFQRLSDAGDLSVLVRRSGAPLARVVRVDKADGEPLGVEVSSAVFDRIRTCDNHCAFCFIYQLPKGMRRSLYLKDDDYRLSFLYGNFTTLTRFTELDAERILTERLGPLFVSMVEEETGVTRDRKVLTAEWAGVPFSIMDTGGWLAAGNDLDEKVSMQAERALAEADVILMVVDVAIGVTEEDLDAAKVIRRAGPPVRLVVNKVDDANREAAGWEFVALGLGDPHPVSALHGRGTGDLLDEVVSLLPIHWRALGPVSTARTTARGWPRCRRRRGGTGRAVGRAAPRPIPPRRGWPSSDDRTSASRPSSTSCWVRSARSCTTCRGRHDTIDTVVDTPNGPICFIDTAGLRRPSKTDRGTEQHATLRALRALERAHIALLVIDATVGASHQDQRLAERIGVSGCPAIVVLNKWDLVPTDDRDDVLAGVGDRLAFLGSAPVLKVSALSGKGVHRILPALRDSEEAYHQRVPTGVLNRAVQELQARQAGQGRASATSSKGRSTLPPSPSSSTPVCRRRTCATSSAGCGRNSTWVPHR